MYLNRREAMIRYNSFDGFATIFLDRPKKAHAYNNEMLDQLEEALKQLTDVPVCMISSTGGRHFCAGADFTRSSYKEESDPYERLYQEAVRLFKTKKPVTATIQGAAVGGGLGVALSADFRIACEESRLVQIFQN